jgi:hypothetical protein
MPSDHAKNLHQQKCKGSDDERVKESEQSSTKGILRRSSTALMGQSIKVRLAEGKNWCKPQQRQRKKID